MKTKICGITNPEDALLCEESGADALGFIFYRKSRRYISSDDAEEIINSLSPFTVKVGVFVNEDISVINEISECAGLNMVQLHGDEKPEDIGSVHLPVIKSFRIHNGFDFNYLQEFRKVSFLFDSFSQDEYGGTGKIFNWSIIPEEYKSKIILSGGISAENIEDIYRTIRPAAVDLASSVESSPGKKDKEKVKQFFKKINYLRR